MISHITWFIETTVIDEMCSSVQKKLRKIYGDSVLIKLVPYFSVIRATVEDKLNKGVAWH